MPIGGRNISRLSGKEMFRLWAELSSLAKVASHLENMGVVNPETGKKYYEYTIWMAAMNYVINNPDEARPYYINQGYGWAKEVITWNRFLVNRASKNLKSNKAFKDWMDGKNLKLEDYKEQWKHNHNFDRFEK